MAHGIAQLRRALEQHHGAAQIDLDTITTLIGQPQKDLRLGHVLLCGQAPEFDGLAHVGLNTRSEPVETTQIELGRRAVLVGRGLIPFSSKAVVSREATAPLVDQSQTMLAGRIAFQSQRLPFRDRRGIVARHISFHAGIVVGTCIKAGHCESHKGRNHCQSPKGARCFHEATVVKPWSTSTGCRLSDDVGCRGVGTHGKHAASSSNGDLVTFGTRILCLGVTQNRL